MQSVPDRVEILVRDNRPEDYAALCTLLGALFEEYRSQIDSRVFLAYLGDLVDGEMQRPARVLVAESGGEVVGTVTYRPGEGDQATATAGLATLRALAVGGDWRRRGVGRLLIQRCIDLARADGSRTLCLHAPEAMVAALSFCRSVGFQATPALDFRVKRDCPEREDCGLVARAFCLPLVEERE
jgi:predicted N-acetyltransferase YhbS